MALQKVQALKCCPECGVHYTEGVAEDERMHARLHNRHRHGVRLPVWQDVRLATASSRLCSSGDRILLILPDDPPNRLAKVLSSFHTVENAREAMQFIERTQA